MSYDSNNYKQYQRHIIFKSYFQCAMTVSTRYPLFAASPSLRGTEEPRGDQLPRVATEIRGGSKAGLTQCGALPAICGDPSVYTGNRNRGYMIGIPQESSEHGDYGRNINTWNIFVKWDDQEELGISTHELIIYRLGGKPSHTWPNIVITETWSISEETRKKTAELTVKSPDHMYIQ